MPRIANHQQGPPFCIQVELIEGCNLRCAFCGINGIRGKKREWKSMSVSTAKRVIALLLKHNLWNPRIEFAMHGEPTLHPQMFQIVREFRNRLPSIHLMMSSNGAGFLNRPTEKIDSVLKYLNVLAIEDYEGVNTAKSILRKYKGMHRPILYPENRQGNPHRRRSTTNHDLVVIASINKATSGTHASLNNHCGCGAPPNDSAFGKRCAKPFREMSIRWDGSVALCCNDWRGYYQCGNVRQKTLEEIWNGTAFRAARKKLYHGLRDFVPCQGCDALSCRPGLLPDQRGKVSVERPTDKDLEAIRLALCNGPLTTPVLRPWEAG